MGSITSCAAVVLSINQAGTCTLSKVLSKEHITCQRITPHLHKPHLHAVLSQAVELCAVDPLGLGLNCHVAGQRRGVVAVVHRVTVSPTPA